MELVPILPGRDVRRVEPVLERVRRAPLARDHRVLPRLIPEVVVELSPPFSGSQRPTIENSRASSTAKPPGTFPSASPSIEIVTMSAGHAVHGVRRDELSFLLHLLALDHSLIRGAARLGDIEDMETRGTDARHDSSCALQASSGTPSGAGVPAEVVQLVPDVRHRVCDGRSGRRDDSESARPPTAMKSGRLIPVPSYSAAT